jgi:beta-glucosidase
MPRATGQVPIYYNHKNSGRPIGWQNFTSRYVDLPHGPLFQFGFGLSYTTFQFSNLSISSLAPSGPYEISAEVTNTGDRAGSEVVQFYTRDLVASISRPVKELKGFQRVMLKSAETKKVTFRLNPSNLTFTGIDDLPI